MNAYRREDVLRILRLPSRQLNTWERAGLVPSTEEYSFQDLAQVRKLRDLTANRISVSSIRRSVDAMQKVSGLANPLVQSAAVRVGSGVVFRQWGALVNPISRQMAFDFELAPCAGMQTARTSSSAHPEIAAQAQEMFLRAVRLEESSRTVGEAAEMYRGILELQPNHAPAAINLGTIYYNQRDFAGAESMYRKATIADPEYALAFFDLGNVLDEQQRLPEAIESYEQALKLVPGYADAHYNIALAYERLKEPRKALRHWTAYAKLDPTGPWASHARQQAKRILAQEPLAIVCRHGRQMKGK
ncbi:Tetratricopeptide repeat-containing protein [Bryocella elongata]|uniref:Tetratricopeptide repeat-containing protein n=1 Tax=Bryocella elongata TaxID=863522 RepID=A0A1H5S3X0_9BACT|nr:tetratricopeptide repeat protein [Bryocella elongata]SEF45044.1 Tetratricopeptide repeat-containing protein [Bryocella elongata]